MKVFIVDTSNKKEFININKSDYIKDIKEKIKIKKGINTDIYLHVNGIILEDNNQVNDYDIEENNCIIYTGTFRGGKKYNNISNVNFF